MEVVAMRALQVTVAIAGVLAIAVPSGLDSCAIGPPTAVFATAQRPADLSSFSKEDWASCGGRTSSAI